MAPSPTEEEELSQLLGDQVAVIFEAEDDLVNRTNAVFIEHRFRSRLARYDSRSRRLGWSYEVFGVVVIAGGLITSGTIALGDPDDSRVQVFLIGVGLLVGVLTAINQIVRPGARSVNYGRAAADLRQEGWDFLYKRGPYRAAESDPQRYEVLVDEISEIHQRAETLPGRDGSPDGQAAV
jgi:hypothetical protein